MADLFNRYVEFVSRKPDTNPQTGESKPKTIVDMYVFPDRVELWGWGTIDTIQPQPGASTDDVVERIKSFMQSEGFIVSCDEINENAVMYDEDMGELEQ